MSAESEEKLSKYIRFSGILLCNVNPFLPSLDDVGGSWGDVVRLMEKREVFYCKAFQKRTTYLSREAYFLLKQCRRMKPRDEAGHLLLHFLEENGPSDTQSLRQSLLLDKKVFTKALDRLLENLDITVLQNGETLNPTWSTFLWGLAEEWEKGLEYPKYAPDTARERLYALLGNQMTAKDFGRLVG